MNLQKDTVDDVLVLRLKDDRLDSQIAPELKTQFLFFVHQGHRNIAVDLHAVDYADSSGLGALLFGQRQAREAGGTLVTFGLKGRIATLIRIARLDKVIVNYASESEALASFSAQSQAGSEEQRN